MTPERWQRVRSIFDSALEKSKSGIEDFVRAECAGDAELYSEIRRMLDENVRAGFLDHPNATASRFPSALEPESVIAGRYRIVRAVGRGGMGEIYEAEDLELKERVALKTLLPDIAADTRMIARFKQEIRLSRKVTHPHVCRVFDLARHPADGSGPDVILFLTMEFLNGETLSARLQRGGRMTAAEALPLIGQMADALDAAHGAGIIHRDFKPSNVMLITDGMAQRAVVTDFGLARRLTRPEETTATVTGQLMGTVDYMAPELFAGDEATAASDIYALGLGAYKMVTGDLPFESRSPPKGVKVRFGQIPSARARVPELDPAWDRAFSRALDPDPSLRFTTARAFVQALSGQSESVTVKLPSFTAGRIAMAVTLAMLLLGAVIGWRVWEAMRSRLSPEAEALYRKGADDLIAGAYFAATNALQQAVKLAPNSTLAHARLAEAWVALDFPEKASQEMLLGRRQDMSTLSPRERLQVEAIDLTITREFAAAAAKYQQMERLAPGNADVEVELGRAWENAGRPDKAIESYRTAAEGPGRDPAAWLRLAMLYNRGGNPAKADEAFTHAEQLYQLTSNLEGLTEVAFQRGAAATARGQYDLSASYLREAMATARLSGNLQQEIRARLQLGTNAYATGDAALAEQYAREALDTARANRVESLAIRGLVTLGFAYQRKRDYAGAESHFQEALGIARGSGAGRFVALCLLSLAALHDEQVKPDLVAREATEALDFYDANAYVKETFQCHILVGRAHLRLGDSQTALKEFQLALEGAGKAQDRSLMDLAEESLGAAFVALQDFPRALDHFQKELALSAGPERRGYAGRNCGYILWTLGRYREASSALDAAEADGAKVLSLRLSLLRDRADMALSQNHFADAAALSRKALAADTGQNPRANSELNRTMGLALVHSGQRVEGLRRCQESLTSAATLHDPLELLDARLALLEASVAVGDRATALRVFHEAEPVLVRYPASRWRGLALISQVNPDYLAPARDALTAIQKSWGDPAFTIYVSRPDFAPLSRPLLQSGFANLK